MAIHKPTRGAGGNAINVRYSALLGGLYVSNPEVEAELDKIKAEVCGKDPAAFTGFGNGSNSSRAANMAREKGIDYGIQVEGELVYAASRTTPEGYEYAAIGLRDGGETVFISTPLAIGSTQMMVRKLLNANPGERVTVSLFATYDESKDESGRFFPNHHASIKDAEGKEIPGVNPQEELQPMLDEAIKKLQAAGVDDKETINKRRSVLTLDWHKGLLNESVARFEAYRAENSAAASAGNEMDGGKVQEENSPFAAENAAAPEAAVQAETKVEEPDAEAVAAASKPRGGARRSFR